MKQFEFFKILYLIEVAFGEYANWGESEIYKTSLEKKNNVKFYTNLMEKLDILEKKVKFCKKCSLGKYRLNTVFGEGNLNTDLMFIGEGPGYFEDHTGKPFVGKAGQLLTKIIEAMGRKRESVYITNIVKCHPMIDPFNSEKHSNNRVPSLTEMKICKQYLDSQIEIIQPKIIVALGSTSTKGLINISESLSDIRGKIMKYKNIKLISTYHPAALLRNPNLKRKTWEDIKKVMYLLNVS
ncbi:MAG: uracil-DNA glycosylase [Endomicrobium sp.]|jgi:DNA polymerase|nr:uracil-DNA glycosylase [Endomicrobium sp.]